MEYKATKSFIDPLTGAAYRIGAAYLCSSDMHTAYLEEHGLILAPEQSPPVPPVPPVQTPPVSPEPPGEPLIPSVSDQQDLVSDASDDQSPAAGTQQSEPEKIPALEQAPDLEQKQDGVEPQTRKRKSGDSDGSN